ncbi:MAG TPA: sigma-70 family RNA polymerase sigma factor [Planctomycetaceae bacterium]|nr:sigma-70 family RNA polymerase sigma factor [Planctomycetaceae bacterium]
MSSARSRKTVPSEFLSPEQIARLDQLLAESSLVIESPEFRDSQQSVAIERDCTLGDAGKLIAAPAGTPPYLASLYDTPLLTKEQEFHLFRQMHFYRFRAREIGRKLRGRSPRVADFEQFQHWLSEANRVRNLIVQANLRLVVSIAKTMVDAGSSLDELISEGNVPLLRAVEIFDYTRGLRFSTYATWAIRHSLYRLTPRNRLRRKRFVTGLESADFQPAAPMPETVDDSHSTRRSIATLLTRLDERERVIVERRFGLGKSPRSFKFREIAGELHISTERVRQLLNRALDRLRAGAERIGLDQESAA